MVHASAPSAKSVLRLEMRARRHALAAAAPEAAARAAAELPLDRLPAFTVVSGYRPVGSELDPWPVLETLAARGAKIALPAALDRAAPLVFRLYAPGDPLAPDAFGIPSPVAGAQQVSPDLVIAPLVAFDRHGGRLGQGGGHYDRTIANLRAAGPVFVLGLAYAGQEVAEVPGEPHDERLDAILTETGYRAVRKD